MSTNATAAAARAAPEPLVVDLAATREGVIALPRSWPSRYQYLATALRQEVVFGTWRHALAACAFLGITVLNREVAAGYAQGDPPLPASDPCFVCGRASR